MKETRFESEMLEAGAAVRRQLQFNEKKLGQIVSDIKRKEPGLVVTCARGSSDHAATYAKYLIEGELHLPVASAAPSLSSVFGSGMELDAAVFLAVSQSGASPDLVQSAKLARENGALVVAMVNVKDSPLEEVAHHVLPLLAGEEKAVAATKSYIASLAAIASLVAAWKGDATLNLALKELPDSIDAALNSEWSEGAAFIKYCEHIFIIGRGVGLGVAAEAALKLKETSRLHAEAYSAAEVQHGPMALIGPDFPALFFVQSDASRISTLEIAEKFLALGAPVIIAGERHERAISLPLPTDSDPRLTPILLIAAFYTILPGISLARGSNPDNPVNLKKVTETI